MTDNKHIHEHNIRQDVIHHRGIWRDSEEGGITHDCRDHGNILKGNFVWNGPWHLGRFFKVGWEKTKEKFFRHKGSMCKSTELREYVSCS